MFYNCIVLLGLVTSSCFGACTLNIPEAVKKEYAFNMYRAFELQAEGESTTAFCFFDVGYEKAKKAGESIYKLDAIRRYFVWYRTYGYFLGLIAKPTGIIGEYKGPPSKMYSLHGTQTQTHSCSTSPEKKARIRDFLFGISEVIAGSACVYFLPSWETKLGFGAPLIYSGVERIWESANYLWLQYDIAIIELKQISNSVKAQSQ